MSSTLAAEQPASAQAGVNPWVVAPTIAMAAFMEVLDTSIANVSLQHIGGSLSASQEESTWVLTSYLVANAIVLPISGWIASVMGRKRFFLACIFGFTLSSLLCGLAPNLTALVVFRAIQGLTGGGLQPIAQAILTDTFPPEKRGLALALFGVSVVFAPAIGPTLGGWITEYYSWRWVFLVNVPVGFLLYFLANRNVHDPEVLTQARREKIRSGWRMDYIGFGLLALGLGFLQVVLDKGQQQDWLESNFIISLSLISAVALVIFVYWELRSDDPIVDFRLLADRNFAVSCLLMFMLGFVLLGSTVLIPIFAQTMMGYNALEAGKILSPGGFLIMGMMPLVALLGAKVDVRWMIGVGLFISALALFNLAQLNREVGHDTLVYARMYQGLGLALLFIPINAAAYADIPTLKSNNAAAIINLFRNLGASVGISVVVTLLARGAQTHQNILVTHSSALDPQYQAQLQGMAQRFAQQGADAATALHQAQAALYAQVQQQSTLLAFTDAFQWLGWAFLLLMPVILLLKPMRINRESMAGH